MAARTSKRVFTLADAMLLLLALMVPAMLLLGVAEGRAESPTLGSSCCCCSPSFSSCGS